MSKVRLGNFRNKWQKRKGRCLVNLHCPHDQKDPGYYEILYYSDKIIYWFYSYLTHKSIEYKRNWK